MGPKAFIDLGGEVITELVVDVDIKNKTLKVKSEEQYSFEKLVFATGSQATIASFIPGYDLQNVYYIKKSYDYIKYLYNELKEKKNIVVVGGGFIGAEMAEQLAKNDNRKVTLIESEEFCFSKAFSNSLSEIATEELKKSNINVHLSTTVEKVLGSNGLVSGIQLKDKGEIKADAVIFAVGYKPNTELAKNSGLQINKIGAIVVDNYEQTSEDGIYAVGDCSQTLGFLTGRCDCIMLASTATAEARVLGYNLFGIKIKKSFCGTIGVFSTEINGLAMAATGVNEKSASPANIDFITSQFSTVDRHPGSIKDSSPLTVKLFVSPSDGSILGGEVWGGKSSGEIINIIGLSIQKGVTVYELISSQIGTHPLLTSAPTMPAFIKAAELAVAKLQKLKN